MIRCHGNWFSFQRCPCCSFSFGLFVHENGHHSRFHSSLMYVAHLVVFKTELTFQTPGLLSPRPLSYTNSYIYLSFSFSGALCMNTQCQQGFSWTSLHHFSLHHRDFYLCFFLRANCSWCLWQYWVNSAHLLIYWFWIFLYHCYVSNALYLSVFQAFRWKILNSILFHLWHKNVWQFSRSMAWLKEKPRLLKIHFQAWIIVEYVEKSSSVHLCFGPGVGFFI